MTPDYEHIKVGDGGHGWIRSEEDTGYSFEMNNYGAVEKGILGSSLSNVHQNRAIINQALATHVIFTLRVDPRLEKTLHKPLAKPMTRRVGRPRSYLSI